MIDQRTDELIQSGVDGELDAAGQAELKAVLDASAEARHRHAELSGLARFLEQLPGRDPPRGLQARILQDVELPAGRSRAPRFRLNDAPSLLRYGFAGAAALVLAVVIALNSSDIDPGTDVSSMVGTMTRPQAAGEVLDRFSLASGPVQGEFLLERRDGLLVMNADLDAPGPYELAVDLSATGLVLNGFVQSESVVTSINYKDDLLLIGGSGRQRFAVVIEHQPGAGEGRLAIGLSVTGQGEPAQQGRLELPRAPG